MRSRGCHAAAAGRPVARRPTTASLSAGQKMNVPSSRITWYGAAAAMPGSWYQSHRIFPAAQLPTLHSTRSPSVKRSGGLPWEQRRSGGAHLSWVRPRASQGGRGRRWGGGRRLKRCSRGWRQASAPICATLLPCYPATLLTGLAASICSACAASSAVARASSPVRGGYAAVTRPLHGHGVTWPLNVAVSWLGGGTRLVACGCHVAVSWRLHAAGRAPDIASAAPSPSSRLTELSGDAASRGHCSSSVYRRCMSNGRRAV